MSIAYKDREATVSFFEREVNFCCQFSLIACQLSHAFFFSCGFGALCLRWFLSSQLLKTRKLFRGFEILFCSSYAPALELVLSNSFRVKCRSLQLQILSGLNRKLNENFTSHTLRTYSLRKKKIPPLWVELRKNYERLSRKGIKSRTHTLTKRTQLI